MQRSNEWPVAARIRHDVHEITGVKTHPGAILLSMSGGEERHFTPEKSKEIAQRMKVGEQVQHVFVSGDGFLAERWNYGDTILFERLDFRGLLP